MREIGRSIAILGGRSGLTTRRRANVPGVIEDVDGVLTEAETWVAVNP